jgi:hypothetical protein
MLRPLLPALCLTLAACLPPPVEAPRPGVPGLSACGGEGVLPLIGQDVAALPASGGWGALRIIAPDMAVTEDYSESRLNVQIDAYGVILGAYCG